MIQRVTEVGPSLQAVLEVIQHAQLWHCPGLLNALLGDTLVGHGSLKAIQRLCVLTQVVGHIPIGIDCKEICTT